jgi:hypothetical protein
MQIQTDYDITPPPCQLAASRWNFPPAQFHNSFTKTQVYRSWKKGIAMLSVLYHAVLKFPKFHRVVETVSKFAWRLDGRKKGLGFQVWALMHSRGGWPRLHFALSRTSTLLCCFSYAAASLASPLSDSPRYRPSHPPKDQGRPGPT